MNISNNQLAIMLGLVLAMLIGMLWFAAANVTVRVFQSHATGGLVYCRTGSLPASSYEDLGTASVAVADAVDCP